MGSVTVATASATTHCVRSDSLTTNIIMGNSRSSLQLQPEDITAIQEETGFNQNQIERLYSRFSSLDKQDKGYLSREDFLRIPELAINPSRRELSWRRTQTRMT